jgi:hypothetical protein
LLGFVTFEKGSDEERKMLECGAGWNQLSFKKNDRIG